MKPTIVKDEQGKVVAVTLTNEEHQVQEVLWQAPRDLSDDEIDKVARLKDVWFEQEDGSIVLSRYIFARAILKKASEK